ncbi:endonuclease [Halomonas sp. I5-271120]|uniref:endonuclease n=1 Tax=Halomonas sp. I5-271120 TaxID=3061632 RepID=UPI002714984B|nr:endonuclease [Halomonas sp. I5-271120]
MKRKMSHAAIATAMVLSSQSAFAFIAGSWNVKQLGWGDHKEYEQVAHIAQSMDLIALQEVMSPEALETLVEVMEQSSGEEWGVMASRAIGRGSYEEHYAYVWRESAVDYSGQAVIFLDSRDIFSREPFLAKFRSEKTGQEVAFANIHVLYGDSVGDRLPEIQALDDIWDFMSETYPGIPRVIAGDFNLDPGHPGWSELTEQGVRPMFREGATTLSSHDGRYANLYDNLWLKPGELDITDAGMIRFPEVLGISHEVARKKVSDHAPIYMALEGAELQLQAYDAGAGVTLSDSAYGAPECINLNTASQAELEELPHIGPSRAELILQDGPWSGAKSLQRIRGLGDSRTQDIEDSGMLCAG